MKSRFHVFSLSATLLFLPFLVQGAENLRPPADWTNRLPSIAVSTYAEIPVSAKSVLKVRVAAPGMEAPLSFRAPCPVSTFAIRRYAGRLALYADGKPFADVADEWDGPVDVQLPLDVLSGRPEEDDYVQPLGFFTFADAFMTADKENGLREWSVRSGDWGLHAVTGLTVSGEALANGRGFPTPDRSPNFYSLNGSGEHGVILAGETFQSHYAVRCSIRHTTGTNGIAFLMHEPDPSVTTGDGLPVVSGYAFLVATDPADGRLFFSLRRDCRPGKSAGDFVAGAKTDLAPGQWYLLEARLSDDHIVCLVDHREILRAREDLPAGGMYGLYVSAPGESPTSFDDFLATSWNGISLATLAEGERDQFLSAGKKAPVRSGRFAFPGSSPFALDVSAQKEHIRIGPGEGASRYYGAADDPPGRIELGVDLPDGGVAELGVGLTDRKGAAPYRMRLCREGGKLRLSCLAPEAGPGTPEAFREIILPAGRYKQPLMMALDATTPGLVSWRVDDDTLALLPVADGPAGAVGFALSCGARSPLEASLPIVGRSPSPYTDLFEKNKRYVVDPYMRHWASAEGQWLPYTNGLAWYKDDVFRRVSVDFPLADGYSLDLDVPEDETNGTFRLNLASNVLQVLSLDGGRYRELARFAYPGAQIRGDGRTLSVTNTATVRLDGAVFLVGTATNTICLCEAPLPHRGRRMLLTLPYGRREFLRHFLVHREPVYDFLFGESLHDWIINGGRWEIINRFQCYPAWSHMNGENKESLAALWAKYEFFGDFGLTFIAGMRHGWYERLGDLNVTILNRRATPSEGYSLVVSGWDPDRSQRWSRLFRDGVPLARSDAQAVPRYRNGNKRTGYEPMLAKGRDVHGAWYTINLRKTGGKLSFSFDHLPVIEVEDPKPLSHGGLGIWTYRNSMVVARVRVTAEAVRPRPVPATPADRDLPQAPGEDVPAAPPARGLSFHGQPVQMLRRGLWHANDEISCPEVVFSGTKAETEMTATSLHGSGSFLVSPRFSPSNEVPAAALAGWRLEVARSEGARFNLEYRVKTGKGPGLCYTHVICGSDETRGPRKISGRCAEAPRATPRGKPRVWTPVTVWLPSLARPLGECSVVLEGFGDLQPGDVQQGLEGNGPGEWYAIRKMYPVFRDATSLLPELDGHSDLARALRKGKAKKVNEVKAAPSDDPDEPLLLWTVPPADSQGLLATVRMEPTPMIRVASTLPWPNPLLCVSNVALDGVAVGNAFIEDNVLAVPVPRPLPAGQAPRKVSFMTFSGRPFTQILPSRAFAAETPPTLVGLDFPEWCAAGYQDFESLTDRASAYRHRGAAASIEFGDAIQSAYLRFDNRGRQNRLTGILAPRIDPIASPLLHLRYRGGEMSFVDLVGKSGSFYALALPPFPGDPPPGPRKKAVKRRGKRARPFSIGRRGPDAGGILDGQWHFAQCDIGYAPAFIRKGEVFLRKTNALTIASVDLSHRSPALGGADQTGCYSTIDFDEISFGPALGAGMATNFAFRATFDAPNGLARGEYAVVRTDGEYNPGDAVECEWHEFLAGTGDWVRPLPAIPEDGRYHLRVRAADRDGAWSKVAVVPFMIDSEPPSVELGGVPDDLLSTGMPPHLAQAFKNSSLLAIRADGGDGAPATFSGMTVRAAGSEVSFGKRQSCFGFFHEDNVATFALNWPVVLRDVIQASTNGTEIGLSFSGISDGAGNRSDDFKTTIKIDYSKDKKPPLLEQNPKIPCIRSMAVLTPQETLFTKIGPGVSKQVTKAKAGEDIAFKTYLTTDAEDTHFLRADFKKELPWKIRNNRWIMFKLRIPPASFAMVSNSPLLTLSLATARNSGKPAVLDLFATTNATPPCLVRPETIKGGEFFDVALDARAFLEAGVGEDLPEEIDSFQLTLPARKGYALDIAAAFITDGWPDDEKISLPAYDESGIDGLYWGKTRITGKWEDDVSITPREIRRRLPPDVTLPVLRLRDRAGNEPLEGFVIPTPPTP